MSFTNELLNSLNSIAGVKELGITFEMSEPMLPLILSKWFNCLTDSFIQFDLDELMVCSIRDHDGTGEQLFSWKMDQYDLYVNARSDPESSWQYVQEVAAHSAACIFRDICLDKAEDYENRLTMQRKAA